MRLVYEKPALRWGEALPLGNGQIGAMVYGGADCEEIDLTEHTFYSGEVEKTANREGAATSRKHVPCHARIAGSSQPAL